MSVEDAQSGCMWNHASMTFPPLREGGMPEGFVASNACKVRKVFTRRNSEGLRSNFGVEQPQRS